jgi:hypothetical protein
MFRKYAGQRKGNSSPSVPADHAVSSFHQSSPHDGYRTPFYRLANLNPCFRRPWKSGMGSIFVGFVASENATKWARRQHSARRIEVKFMTSSARLSHAVLQAKSRNTDCGFQRAASRMSRITRLIPSMASFQRRWSVATWTRCKSALAPGCSSTRSASISLATIKPRRRGKPGSLS